MKLCVVGTGYVGLVSGTCLADYGHDVVCVDIDADKVARINRGEPPIHEDGLEALILALFLRRTFLQEVEIRVDLQLNKIGRRDNFFKLTEVDAIGVITVGHGEFPD